MSDAREFCIASRGDRARGRWKPGPPGRSVILAAPDGTALHPWIASRFAAWGDAATLIALDLPLCGTRTSEKFSEHGLDPDHPLSARIRPDLEVQLAADLVAAGSLAPAGDAIHFVGCGPHSAWFRAACERTGGLASVHVQAEPDEAWHDEVLRGLRA